MWDKEGLGKAIEHEFNVQLDIARMIEEDDKLDEQGVHQVVLSAVEKDYDAKVESIGPKIMRMLEKDMMLRQLDSHWKEHISALDYLRQGIHLRSFAQRNPKQEYKREAFEMFSGMLDRVKHDTITILSKVQVRRPEDVSRVEAPRPDAAGLQFKHAEAPSLRVLPQTIGQAATGQTPAAAIPRVRAPGAPPPQAEGVAPFVREQPKVGRNHPCPCGSGKKFKHCHGSLN
jgi:preprotein translocase subunit SecA